MFPDLVLRMAGWTIIKFVTKKGSWLTCKQFSTGRAANTL